MHGSKGNPCKPKMAPSKPKKKEEENAYTANYNRTHGCIQLMTHRRA